MTNLASPPINAGAAHVVAGFRYQILQSLAAWMGLQPDEELWLEVSEDFSIASKDAATDVQVKSSQATAGPRSFSLQSSDILGALRRFWINSDEGRDSRRLIFLAQGSVAIERGHSFPGGIPGLRYWRKAALDGDTAPMRKALAALFQNEPLADWIATNPTDGELRTRLLRRVQWETEALSANDLQTHLKDQVGMVLLTKSLPVLAGNPAFGALLAHAFETASRPRPEERRLRPLDLHRVLEETIVAMRLGTTMSEAPLVDATGVYSVLVNEVEEPPTTFAPREAVVENFLDGARGKTPLWIYGAHGVGKSTLARLLAKRMGGRWLGLDLRPVQKEAVGSLAAWRELMRILASNGPADGIVIDDLAEVAADTLRPRVNALVRTLEARGARVVITSPQAPSPARLLEMGTDAAATIQAPYFTQDEVTGFIGAALAPTPETIKAWAIFIWMASGGGHPLITAAKVSNLRTRNWPSGALVEDLSGTTSEAVRATRDDARQSLIRELSTLGDARAMGAGQLLRRIGSVFDRVDDALARRLITDQPSIANGGDVLAVLRGTWLEPLPGGDLRVSPLLRDITSDVPQDEARRWRRVAAEHWLSTRVLNERTLPLCFWNALLGEHDWVLLKLCTILQSMPRRRLLGATALLSPLTAFAIDRSLYAGNVAIGVQLRLLQFEIADAVEEPERAEKIASRLLVELDDLPHADLKAMITTVAATKVLAAEVARVSPAERIEYSLRLREASPRAVALGNGEIADPNVMLHAEYGTKVDIAGFYFSTIIRHISGSADQLEVIKALDNLGIDERNRFIDAIGVIYSGHAVFVSSGWSRDQTEGRDMAVAFGYYEDIAAIVASWNRRDLMLELACAKSVILDEGLQRIVDAIAVIDDAERGLGPHPALTRQKSKVLGHAGRDSEATDLLIGVEDEVGLDSPLERALALRDGGVSAARSGRLSDSVRLFQKAHAALLNNPGSKPLAAGLLVERSLALWELKQRSEAISTAADALDAVATFQPTESRQAERSHQFARAICGFFIHELEPFRSTPRPPLTIGLASSLHSDKDDLLNLNLKPLANNWRILALVEAQAEVNVGVEARSVAKQTGARVASIEAMINMAHYVSSMKSGVLTDAFRLGIAATAMAKAVQQLERGGHQLGQIENLDTISSSLGTLLAVTEWREVIQRLPVDAILYRHLVGSVDASFLDSVRRASAEIFGDDSVADAVLLAASGQYDVGPETPFPVAVAKALSISARAVEEDPSLRFRRDMMIVGHLANSLARRLLIPAAAIRLREGWTMVVRDQRFRLRDPSRNVPGIEAAIALMETRELQGAAELILMAAPAVKFELPDGWLNILQQMRMARD